MARELSVWLFDQRVGALAHLLDELPQRPMMVGQLGLRLSLAGAQDKHQRRLLHGIG